MSQHFQQRIIKGKVFFPMAVAFAILLWSKNLPWQSGEILFLEDWGGGYLIPTWIAGTICLLGCFTATYLLADLNHNYSLMGIRTTFPCSLFLLLWASTTIFSHSIEGNILLCCFAIEIFYLFGCYQQPLSIGQTFLLFLTVGIGNIVSKEHFIYAPLYYLLLVFFQGLSVRSFFAGLVGFILPYWWIFAFAFWSDEMSVFSQLNSSLEIFDKRTYTFISPIEWILLGYIAILSISGSIYLLRNDFQNKLRTRALLQALLIWICYSSIALFLLPAKYETLLPAIYWGTAIIGGHMFSHSSNKISNWCFILALLILALIAILNIWRPQYLFF